MKNININKKHIIKIYRNDIFIGYLKSYRKHRNGKYRFEKTLNVNDCMRFLHISEIENVLNKLTTLLDLVLYFKDIFNFKKSELTEQEIRNSKLCVLNVIKIREGIFKK